MVIRNSVSRFSRRCQEVTTGPGAQEFVMRGRINPFTSPTIEREAHIAVLQERLMGEDCRMTCAYY
jgi:hypothetical protein